MDVRSEASTAEMAAGTIEHFGGIDILINNAAIMTDLPPYGLSNMPVAEWDRVLNVNLRGPLLCTQAVIESMDSSRRRPGHQRAVRRRIHGRRHLRCQQVRPPRVDRPTSPPSWDLEASTSTASPPASSPARAATSAFPRIHRFETSSDSRSRARRRGRRQDLVGAMLLLCSPAGDWINGQTISVDGGWIMRL